MIVIVMYHMVHDMHGMANVLRHSCDDGLLQPVSIPSPGAALLLVAAAPALLGLGPAIVPVLDASDAVVVALLNHVLNLRDGNLLVDGLGSHRNRHVDHLARHAHRNGHGLVAVLRRGWHGLRHVVLLRNHLVHDVGRASRLDLDQRRRVLVALQALHRSHPHLNPSPTPKKDPRNPCKNLQASRVHGNLHHVVDLFRRRGRHRDLHWHSDVMDVGDGLVVVPWRRTLRKRSRASLATNHMSTHGTPKAGELSAQQPRVLYWTLAGTRMGGGGGVRARVSASHKSGPSNFQGTFVVQDSLNL